MEPEAARPANGRGWTAALTDRVKLRQYNPEVSDALLSAEGSLISQLDYRHTPLCVVCLPGKHCSN
jgi:hypothetical protein